MERISGVNGPTTSHLSAERGLTHSTLSGMLWMFLGSGSQAVLQLAVLVALARLLTPADFGIVSAAQVVVGFTTIFSQLGVGPALVQRPDLAPRHLRTAFTLSMMIGALMTATIWIGAPLLADFFRMPELLQVARALSLIFMLQSLGVVAESLLQREMQFRRLAAIELTAYTVGYGGVGIALACLGLGVWALVCGQMTQSLVKMLLLLKTQSHPKAILVEVRAARELLYFGSGFTMARVGNYIAGQVDNLVVGRWLGAAALGIYGRAYQLMTAPANFLGQILDRVLFPAMSKVQENSQRMVSAYRRGVALIALIIMPASGVLFILAPEVIRLVLGKEWGEVTVPFQIFAAGMLLRTSYKMSDSVARATAAVYRRAWRQTIYAALVAAGAWGGLRWGLRGVAFGVLLAIAVNFLLMAHLSVSLGAVTWRALWQAHIPALALTAIVSAAAWAVAAMLRAVHAGALTVLIASAAAALCGLTLLLRWAPRLVLGEDGLWMVQTLSSYLPDRMNPLQRFHLGIERT